MKNLLFSLFTALTLFSCKPNNNIAAQAAATDNLLVDTNWTTKVEYYQGARHRSTVQQPLREEP